MPEISDNAKALITRAELLAEEMVVEARGQFNYRRTVSFSVILNKQTPPFAFHWKHKNTFGVTFSKKETDAAKAWIVDALLAGFGVCLHFGRHGGTGGIYMLKDWTVPSEMMAH
jgi:hypothetical protein